jgi:tRNA(fMet)-specific endonuclease VapC
MGTLDLRIAAVAVVNSVTLLTRNRRDFSLVSGLVIDDWSV